MNTNIGPHVNFPRVSQILESRRDLVDLLREKFPPASDAGPILLISGSTATYAYAEIYRKLFKQHWGIEPEHVVLENAPKRAEAEKKASEILSREDLPSLVVYVGGQTVADASKVIVHQIRNNIRQRGLEGQLKFGGIITALSSDGVFSVTASVRDDHDLPDSTTAAAPDFVVGHKLTLLRQPYDMKTSCVGDILSKISSLWDYNYSCRVLRKYHNDFAADLTTSAFESLLGDRFDRSYLHKPDSINKLYRAVQLCGLSMQLAGSSETCSGSEHVGQKWLEEYILRYNSLQPPASRLMVLTHGAAVLLTTVVTLYLQGQAEKAERVKQIAEDTGLRFRAQDFGLPAKVIQMCFVLGIGYRCPNYLAHLLGDLTPPVDEQNERVTVLEEVEFNILPKAIMTAMIDAGVADRSEFTPLSGAYLGTMQEVIKSSLEHTREKLGETSTDSGVVEGILAELRSFFAKWLKL